MPAKCSRFTMELTQQHMSNFESKVGDLKFTCILRSYNKSHYQYRD